MVLEAVTLHIRPGQSGEFESAFKQAQSIIASMHGLHLARVAALSSR